MYIKHCPKKEISELKEALVSRESRMKRAYSQEERFLANALRHIKRLYRKVETEKQT